MGKKTIIETVVYAVSVIGATAVGIKYGYGIPEGLTMYGTLLLLYIK